MNPLTLTNAFFSPLFLDGTVARAFSTEATLAAFVGFEAALAEALGDAGLADPAQAAAAAAAIRPRSRPIRMPCSARARR